MSERMDELEQRKALLVARSTLHRLRMQHGAGQLRRSILTPRSLIFPALLVVGGAFLLSRKSGGVMRLFTLVKAGAAMAAWAIAARRRRPGDE